MQIEKLGEEGLQVGHTAEAGSSDDRETGTLAGRYTDVRIDKWHVCTHVGPEWKRLLVGGLVWRG